MTTTVNAMAKKPLAAPKIVPTKFNTWQQAFTWAYHVARCGLVKTKVAKVDGRWCAWRQL